MEEGSNAFYAHGTGNENWIWDQRCGSGLGSKPEVIFTQPPTVLQRADGDFRVFGRASGSGEMVYEYTDGILEYSNYGGIIIYPNFTYGKLDEIMKK